MYFCYHHFPCLTIVVLRKRNKLNFRRVNSWFTKIYYLQFTRYIIFNPKWTTLYWTQMTFFLLNKKEHHNVIKKHNYLTPYKRVLSCIFYIEHKSRSHISHMAQYKLTKRTRTIALIDELKKYHVSYCTMYVNQTKMLYMYVLVHI